MKQQMLFAPPSDQSETSSSAIHWKLFIDGASRNNPGPAGGGLYLLKDSELFLKKGFYLGLKTNNQAEYLALLLGLFFLHQQYKKGDVVRVISDSQLLVRQVLGEYRVKKPGLKPLHALAVIMLQKCDAHVVHVLRTENVVADTMANYGIDKKVAPPQPFLDLLRRHELSL